MFFSSIFYQIRSNLNKIKKLPSRHTTLKTLYQRRRIDVDKTLFPRHVPAGSYFKSFDAHAQVIKGIIDRLLYEMLFVRSFKDIDANELLHLIMVY